MESACASLQDRSRTSTVTDSRDKFWAALNALFGKLTPLEELFLAGDPAAIDAVLEFAEVLL